MKGTSREVQWKNTNKLLKFGFTGLKTGITKNAGPCLSAVWDKKLDKNKEVCLNIIVLNSKEKDDRFLDT